MLVLSCSTQDYPVSDVATLAADGLIFPPNIGSTEYSRLCLAPEALSSTQRAKLEVKVPAIVLANAMRSSVLVTFDTLYPNKKESCLKTCSGTLIKAAGKTKVLTNQHCFSDNFIRGATGDRCTYNRKRQADSFSNPCANTFAHVNFPATDKQPTISLACQGGFAADKELDLAIFDVDADSLPANHPHANLWEGEITTGQEAFLLHHPACGQENFQPIPNTSIGAMIKTITFEDCRIATLPADADELLSSLPQSLFHSCTTLPGSSGAAIRDAKTGAILAVHQAMLELTRTGDAPQTPTKYHYGHGSNLAAVRTFIADAP